MSDCECVPDPGQTIFAPSEVIIYGIDLKNGDHQGVLAVKPNWTLALAPKKKQGTTDFEIVAAYGYAYEGHCYRFDRPRILVFSPDKDFPKPADALGCGFNISNDYQMWRVPADWDVMELTAQIDTFRRVVLEANLPGRRPPNTYASEMMLAHRGGRLTGSGT